MAKNGEGEGRTSVPDVSLFLMFSKGLHCCCYCFLAVPVVAQSDTILFFFFLCFCSFFTPLFSLCVCMSVLRRRACGLLPPDRRRRTDKEEEEEEEEKLCCAVASPGRRVERIRIPGNKIQEMRRDPADEMKSQNVIPDFAGS